MLLGICVFYWTVSIKQLIWLWTSKADPTLSVSTTKLVSVFTASSKVGGTAILTFRELSASQSTFFSRHFIYYIMEKHGCRGLKSLFYLQFHSRITVTNEDFLQNKSSPSWSCHIPSQDLFITSLLPSTHNFSHLVPNWTSTFNFLFMTFLFRIHLSDGEVSLNPLYFLVFSIILPYLLLCPSKHSLPFFDFSFPSFPCYYCSFFPHDHFFIFKSYCQLHLHATLPLLF